MLRKIYSITWIKVRSTCDNLSYRMQMHVICMLLAIIHPPTTFAGEQGISAPEKEPFESLEKYLIMTDIKYWMENTGLARKSNWANEKKPCTLLERIEINEQAVISVTGLSSGTDERSKWSFDIRELTLPINGTLLLGEDSYANVSKESSTKLDDCWHGEDLHELADNVFTFAPDSDSFSWFNPDNWRSFVFDFSHEGLYAYYMPDSHRVPCEDDAVVFGGRHYAVGSDPPESLSFKVNFKPSKWTQNFSSAQNQITRIRVGKLLIGGIQYNQMEFEKLLEVYGDTLFDRSIAGWTDESVSLTIDDTSTKHLYDIHAHECTDKAGCICGNYDSAKLQAICSFEEMIDIEDQPCHDPITTAGYCNKICATALTMSIDPTKFRLPLIYAIGEDILEKDPIILQKVIIYPHRTAETRFEIAFIRNISMVNHESGLGIERACADKFFGALNSPSIKSFYGIRSITVRSSIDWKRSNKNELFWASFTMIALSLVIMNIYGKDSGPFNWLNINETITIRVNHWMDYRFALRTSSRTITPADRTRNEIDADDAARRSDDSGSLAEIALVDLDDRLNIVDDKTNLISKQE